MATLPSRSAIDQVNQLQQSILRDQASMVEKAIQAGHLLIAMKEQVPHGQWMQWCDDNIHIGRSQIGNYMTAARREALLPDYQSSGNTGGLSGFLEYTAPEKKTDKPGGTVEDWLPKGWKGFNQALPEGIPRIGDLVQYFDHAKGRDTKDLYVIINISIDPNQQGRGMYKPTLRRANGAKDIQANALDIWPIWFPENAWSGGARGIWFETPPDAMSDAEWEEKKAGYMTELVMGFVHIDALWDAVDGGEENPQAAAWEVTKEFTDHMSKRKKHSKTKSQEATP